MTIRDCALKVGNFLDSDNLVASYIMYVHERHAFGIPWIYINGTSKYRDADRTYMFSFKARFPLAARSLEIR